MKYGIIGGTGLNRLADFSDLDAVDIATPYGAASAIPQHTSFGTGCEVIFLARHGQPHRVAPHKINYRANLWLMKELGVDCVCLLYTSPSPRDS